MSVYKRGKFFHYRFRIAGKRYRGCTKHTKKAEAEKYEALLKTEVMERGSLVLQAKTPVLRDFSERFLNWVEESERLDPDTKRYYRNGWRMLGETTIAAMRLRDIRKDDVEALKLKGSAANQNNALRTLRRMLWKANEWSVLRDVPRFTLVEEYPRDRMLEAHEEVAILRVCKQPLHDVLIAILDTGMRPSEVFAMRWEHVNWNCDGYFNPEGKTRKARRFIFFSGRLRKTLIGRWQGQTAGWVFPARNKQSSSGHVTTVQKQFQKAKAAAGIKDQRVVLYCARHTFGTVTMAESKNPAAVMDAMGHRDLKTTMVYQHQDLSLIRDVIDKKNAALAKRTQNWTQ